MNFIYILKFFNLDSTNETLFFNNINISVLQNTNHRKFLIIKNCHHLILNNLTLEEIILNFIMFCEILIVLYLKFMVFISNK